MRSILRMLRMLNFGLAIVCLLLFMKGGPDAPLYLILAICNIACRIREEEDEK